MDKKLPYTVYNVSNGAYYQVFEKNKTISEYKYDKQLNKFIKVSDNKEFSIDDNKAIFIKNKLTTWSDGTHTINKTSKEQIQIVNNIGKYDIIQDSYEIVDSFIDKNYIGKSWEEIIGDKNLTIFSAILTPNGKLYNIYNTKQEGNYIIKDNDIIVSDKYCYEGACFDVNNTIHLNPETGEVKKEYNYAYIDTVSTTPVIKPCAIFNNIKKVMNLKKKLK